MPATSAHVRAVKALREYTQRYLSVADVEEMQTEFYGESDRAVVILQALMVEVTLEDAIRKLLRPDLKKEMRREVFGFDGPAGSFAHKILIAFALGVFGSETYRDLGLVRNLRNQFAHSRKALRFTTPEVSAVCRYLRLPDVPGISHTPIVYFQRDEKGASDLTNPKTRYIVSCFSIGVALANFAYDSDEATARSSQLP
jgi:hypothetical protein